MYEDGHTHAQEGLALSADLLHWEKVEESILAYGQPGSVTVAMPTSRPLCITGGFSIIFTVGPAPGGRDIHERARGVPDDLAGYGQTVG